VILEWLRKKKKKGRQPIREMKVEDLLKERKELRERVKYLEEQVRKWKLKYREERLKRRRHWEFLKKCREELRRLKGLE